MSRLWAWMFVSMVVFVQPPDEGAHQAAVLRTRIEAAPRWNLVVTDVPIHLPAGQRLGMISWVTHDPRTGLTWIMQRGVMAEPVLGIDASGRVVHAFGRGLFTIPHAIRIDPDGNVWTVDAGSSHVLKFSPAGKKLLELDIAMSAGKGFGGATDVAFAGSRVFISDGYANARILEYRSDGSKVREWGNAGSGPGQFSLPHSIVIDDHGTLYVADRENGRIEKFDLAGKYLGQIDGLGRTYSLALGADGTLWAAMSPMNLPPGSAGWLVKLDRTTGKMLGYVEVKDSPGLHSVTLTGPDYPITSVGDRLVCFRRH